MFRLADNENALDEMKMPAEIGSSAFDMIYSKYAPLIYGMVCKAVISETKAALLLQEIFTAAFIKICDGEINVHNCFRGLLILTRSHISEFLKSNHVVMKAITVDEKKNCNELIFVKGYSLEVLQIN